MTKLETLQLKLTATRVRMGVIEATHGAVSYTHLTLPTTSRV